MDYIEIYIKILINILWNGEWDRYYENVSVMKIVITVLRLGFDRLTVGVCLRKKREMPLLKK